jgi:FkbM family methyltransferase
MSAAQPSLVERLPSLVRFANIIRHYGVLPGIGIFLRLRRGRGATMTLPLPPTVRPGWEVAIRSQSADVSVFEQVFLTRLYAAGLSGTVSTIVDGGAHVGYSSLFFAAQYPEARVIAVEPEAGNFELLRINTLQSDRITSLHAALWSHDARLEVQSDPYGSTWGFSVTEDLTSQNPQVRAISIPSLMREFELETIDLLKVDIEGAEKELFSGAAAEWLPRVRNILIETHERIYPGSDAAVRRALGDFTGFVKIFEE